MPSNTMVIRMTWSVHFFFLYVWFVYVFFNARLYMITTDGDSLEFACSLCIWLMITSNYSWECIKKSYLCGWRNFRLRTYMYVKLCDAMCWICTMVDRLWYATSPVLQRQSHKRTFWLARGFLMLWNGSKCSVLLSSGHFPARPTILFLCLWALLYENFFVYKV